MADADANNNNDNNAYKADEGNNEAAPKAESITLKLVMNNGDETMFKVKKTTKMKKVFDAFAARKGIQSGALRFFCEGERIHNHQTPADLELEDEDQVDVMLEMHGGGH